MNNVKANTLLEEAVIRFGNSEFIFIEVENNDFEMIQVETGVREKGVIEILNSNQFLNKKVVLNGAYSLLMALKNQEE